jgi:hypothetical protein
MGWFLAIGPVVLECKLLRLQSVSKCIGYLVPPLLGVTSTPLSVERESRPNRPKCFGTAPRSVLAVCRPSSILGTRRFVQNCTLSHLEEFVCNCSPWPSAASIASDVRAVAAARWINP